MSTLTVISSIYLFDFGEFFLQRKRAFYYVRYFPGNYILEVELLLVQFLVFRHDILRQIVKLGIFTLIWIIVDVIFCNPGEHMLTFFSQGFENCFITTWDNQISLVSFRHDLNSWLRNSRLEILMRSILRCTQFLWWLHVLSFDLSIQN